MNSDPLESIVINAFTELAPAYERTMDREFSQFWGMTYAGFIQRLTTLMEIRPGDWVLDVATGRARLPMRLAETWDDDVNLVGLDITSSMLVHAQSDLRVFPFANAVDLVCASGMLMPFADGKFDVVVCGMGTHHMEVDRLLKEMRRVLKPRGQLVIADVYATPFWRSFVGQMVLRLLLVFYGLALRSARAKAEIAAFENLKDRDQWQETLHASGFDEIEIEEQPALRRIYPGGLYIRATAAVES